MTGRTTSCNKINLWNVNDNYRFIKDSDRNTFDDLPIRALALCPAVIGTMSVRRPFMRTSLVAFGCEGGVVRLWDFETDRMWTLERDESELVRDPDNGDEDDAASDAAGQLEALARANSRKNLRRRGSQESMTSAGGGSTTTGGAAPSDAGSDATSTGGRSLNSALYDSWNPASGLTGATVCTSVAFSSNGQMLLACVNGIGPAGDGTTVAVWKLFHGASEENPFPDQEKARFLVQHTGLPTAMAARFFPSESAEAAAKAKEAEKHSLGGAAAAAGGPDAAPLRRGRSRASLDGGPGGGSALGDMRDAEAQEQLAPGQRVYRKGSAMEHGMGASAAFQAEYRIAVACVGRLSVLRIKQQLKDTKGLRYVVIGNEYVFLEKGSDVKDTRASAARESKGGGGGDDVAADEDARPAPYTFAVLATKEVASAITCLDVSEDGFNLVTGDMPRRLVDDDALAERVTSTNSVTLWSVVGDFLTNSRVGKHLRPVRGVAFASSAVSRALGLDPSVGLLASGSLDESMRVWEWNTRDGVARGEERVFERPLSFHQRRGMDRLRSEAELRKLVASGRAPVSALEDSGFRAAHARPAAAEDRDDEEDPEYLSDYDDDGLSVATSQMSGATSASTAYTDAGAASVGSGAAFVPPPAVPENQQQAVPRSAVAPSPLANYEAYAAAGAGAGGAAAAATRRAKGSKMLATFEKFARNTAAAEKQKGKGGTRKCGRMCF